MLIATYLVAIGDYQTAAKFLDPGIIGGPLRLSSKDPLLLAELQLVAAQRARRVSDFEASRNHLDKALVATFSLVVLEAASTRLVFSCGSSRQLVEHDYTERALRLMAAG